MARGRFAGIFYSQKWNWLTLGGKNNFAKTFLKED
jgi:hypothetical protein